MHLDLPNNLISSTAYSEQDLKVDVVVMLYQRKLLTLARAANWVDMTRLQFQKILAERNVPINYTEADFDIDLKSINSMPV